MLKRIWEFGLLNFVKRVNITLLYFHQYKKATQFLTKFIHIFSIHTPQIRLEKIIFNYYLIFKNAFNFIYTNICNLVSSNLQTNSKILIFCLTRTLTNSN